MLRTLYTNIRRCLILEHYTLWNRCLPVSLFFSPFLLGHDDPAHEWWTSFFAPKKPIQWAAFPAGGVFFMRRTSLYCCRSEEGRKVLKKKVLNWEAKWVPSKTSPTLVSLRRGLLVWLFPFLNLYNTTSQKHLVFPFFINWRRLLCGVVYLF